MFGFALDRTSRLPALSAIVLGLALAYPQPVRAQSDVAARPGADDVTQVRRVAQAYLDGLLHGDTATLRNAFAADAQLFGVPGGALQVIPVAKWIESRGGKRLEPENEYRQRVVAVDVSGDAAVARTDLVWPTVHYVDYLSMLKIGGEWKIVNKIWFQEPSARAMAGVRDLPLSPDDMARYIGRYHTANTELQILAAGGGLHVRVGPQEYRLYYQGDDVFAPEFDPTARLTFHVQDGRAREITVNQKGHTATAERTGTP